MDNLNVSVKEQESERKVYETPSLVEYGSVAELTQSGAISVANDGQTHRSRRA